MNQIPLAVRETWGDEVALLPEDRRKHLAVFGKSGVGKSTLLRNMIIADIRAGMGVTVLDPHGALVEDLLDFIPRSRINDVVYFDPAHPDRVLGLNLLEPVPRRQRALLVSSLTSALRNIWPDFWGPRTEYILEHAAFALLEQPQPVSLLALPKLLGDAAYRRRILRHVSDPPIRSFFDTYERWNAKFREEAIAPLLNKVTKFLTHPLLRDVIGQPTSSFDFRWLMDSRKVLLCRFAKGALGEDVSSLLGSLLVTKLSLAALGRQDIAEAERVPHFLFADEVQNFIHGVDFPTILSEARKYRLTLTIATQTLAQLPPASRNAVFGNCATILSYRVSGEDAEALQQEFAMVIPASELQQLPDYKMYVRTLQYGQPSGPHLGQAFPPTNAGGFEAPSDLVIRTSLARFGRSRSMVEARIARFLEA